jgi:hypothetical protein
MSGIDHPFDPGDRQHRIPDLTPEEPEAPLLEWGIFFNAGWTLNQAVEVVLGTANSSPSYRVLQVPSVESPFCILRSKTNDVLIACAAVEGGVAFIVVAASTDRALAEKVRNLIRDQLSGGGFL